MKPNQIGMKTKKWLSVMLTVMLILGMIPMSVFATENQSQAESYNVSVQYRVYPDIVNDDEQGERADDGDVIQVAESDVIVEASDFPESIVYNDKVYERKGILNPDSTEFAYTDSLTIPKYPQEEGDSRSMWMGMWSDGIRVVYQSQENGYKLTVVNGTIQGKDSTEHYFKQGEEFTIQANTPEKGKKFDSWKVEPEAAFTAEKLKQETLNGNMTNSNITFTAQYRNLTIQEVILESDCKVSSKLVQTEKEAKDWIKKEYLPGLVEKEGVKVNLDEVEVEPDTSKGEPAFIAPEKGTPSNPNGKNGSYNFLVVGPENAWRVEKECIIKTEIYNPPVPHFHNICGQKRCNHEEHNGINYEPYGSGGSDSMYLTKNVTGYNEYLPSNLCLNGKIFTEDTTMEYHIQFPVVNLCDCVGGGILHLANDLYRMDNFNMYGGTIEGRVNVAYNFNMYGGRITNPDGIGLDGGEGVNVYGGSITGNKIGVNIQEGEVISMSGHPVIKDNEVNVYVGKNARIYVTNLEKGSTIGITTQVKPTKDKPVNITQPSDKDYSQYFFSDDPAYIIKNSGSGNEQVVQLAVKTDSVSEIVVDRGNKWLGSFKPDSGDAEGGKLITDSYLATAKDTQAAISMIGGEKLEVSNLTLSQENIAIQPKIKKETDNLHLEYVLAQVLSINGEEFIGTDTNSLFAIKGGTQYLWSTLNPNDVFAIWFEKKLNMSMEKTAQPIRINDVDYNVGYIGFLGEFRYYYLYFHDNTPAGVLKKWYDGSYSAQFNTGCDPDSVKSRNTNDAPISYFKKDGKLFEMFQVYGQDMKFYRNGVENQEPGTMEMYLYPDSRLGKELSNTSFDTLVVHLDEDSGVYNVGESIRNEMGLFNVEIHVGNQSPFMIFIYRELSVTPTVTQVNGDLFQKNETTRTPSESKPTVKPADTPKTGDETNPLLWMSLLFIGGCGMAVALRRRRMRL